MKEGQGMGRRWLLVLLLFMLPANVYASETNAKEIWNDIAANTLEFGKQEDFERAKTELNKFSKVFPGDSGSELTSTELRVILNAHDRAIKAVTTVDESSAQRLQSLMEFRLAVDALVAEDQPMWRETDDKLLSLIDEMATSIEHANRDVFDTSKRRFLEAYSTIRPAMAIDLSPDIQQRLDSHIAFIENYASERDSEFVGQLQTMHDDFDAAYHGSTSQESSLFWLIISIGGIITLTLLYVIYRKYLGEKDKVKRKQVD